MKNCPYCGRGYADDVAVCPIDGHPVGPPQIGPGQAAARPPTTRPGFDVRLVAPILSAGKYRIFVERSDLLFIQMEGGPRSILEAAVPLLGPLGFVVSLMLWLFAALKTRAKRQRLEERDPEDLFRESEKNFRLHLAEIRDVTIEAPAFYSTNRQAARLDLLVRHGEKIKCEFESTVEVSTAISLLAPLLNGTLRINVTWNAGNQRFEGKKKDLTR